VEHGSAALTKAVTSCITSSCISSATLLFACFDLDLSEPADLAILARFEKGDIEFLV